MESVCWRIPSLHKVPYRTFYTAYDAKRRTGLCRIAPMPPRGDIHRPVNSFLLNLFDLKKEELHYIVPPLSDELLWEELDKYTDTPECQIPDDWRDFADYYIYNYLVPTLIKPHRVATFREVIASTEGATASGFPWNTTKKNATESTFSPTSPEMPDEMNLEELMQYAEAHLYEFEPAFAAFLKEELRKVQAIVNGVPKAKNPHNIAIQFWLSLVLTKRVCLHFNEQFYALYNRFHSFSAVGLPFEHGCWHGLGRYLDPGDEPRIFVTFDLKSCNYVVSRLWYEIETRIRLKALDAAEFHEQLVWVMNMSCYSYILHKDGTIIRTNHTTKSGDANTTVRNTLFVIWLMLCLLAGLKVDPRELWKKLRMKIAGDNGALSWPLRWAIGFRDLQDAAQKCNVTLTGNDQLQLKGLSFLGHVFTWSEEISAWVPVPESMDKILASIVQPEESYGYDMITLRIAAQMKRCCHRPDWYEYLRRKCQILFDRHYMPGTIWDEVKLYLESTRMMEVQRYSPWDTIPAM